MTTIPAPLHAPLWTKAGALARPPRAMYPLGIDATTQEIERKLFAGITSQTSHVRYYAFYAWALYRFRERLLHEGRRTTAQSMRRAQKRWIARLEAALRAATLLENPLARGMFGAVAARQDSHLSLRGVLPLPMEPPYRTTGLHFFIGPLSDLGAGRLRRIGRSESDEDTRRGEFQAGPVARRLSEALDSLCESQSGGQAALRALMVAAGGAQVGVQAKAIHTLAPALALSKVPLRTPLHERLVELLFAHSGDVKNDPDTPAWDRGSALAFCLEVARQSDGRLEQKPIALVRQAILTGYLAPEQQFEMPDALKPIRPALQRLYERRMLQLSLYGFWRSVVNAIRTSPSGVRSVDGIVGGILRAIEADATGNGIRPWLGKDVLAMSLGDLIAKSGQRAAAIRRAKPWRTGEEQLSLRMVADGRQGTRDVAAPALALLCRVMSARMQALEGGKRVPRGEWHAIGGRQRLALDVVTADAKQRTRMNVVEYVRWVVEAYIIGQSLQATIGKGPHPTTQEYTFYLLPDSGGYRIAHRAAFANYLYFDSPRLQYAMRMLEELQLIKIDPALGITAAGKRVLRDVLERRKSHVSRDQVAAN